jgi:hypothetical protein
MANDVVVWIGMLESGSLGCGGAIGGLTGKVATYQTILYTACRNVISCDCGIRCTHACRICIRSFLRFFFF